MPKYKVIFSYSVDVNAPDEDVAEDMAWDAFAKCEPDSDYFACIVEEEEGED